MIGCAIDKAVLNGLTNKQTKKSLENHLFSKTTSKNIRNSGFLEADGYKDMKVQTLSDKSYFNFSYFRLKPVLVAFFMHMRL